MQQLHDLGFKTAAMALTDLSVSIDDAALAAEPKLAIVLGTEGDGLAHTTIAACDYTVRIPMSHGSIPSTLPPPAPLRSGSWANSNIPLEVPHEQNRTCYPWYISSIRMMASGMRF